MQTLALDVRKEGRVAILTKARKCHRCAVSQELINKGDFYYAVTVGSSGLGGIKFPERVKPEYLDAYFERVRRSREL